MNKIIFLIGESGSGKTYLQENLLKMFPKTYCRIVSTTTREPRVGEEHGTQYMFTDRPNFEILISESRLLQHVEFGGNYYGTELSQYDRPEPVGLFVCTPEGINDTINSLTEKGIQLNYEIICFMTSNNKLAEHGIDSNRVSRGNIRHQFTDMLINNEFNGIDIRVVTDNQINHSLVDNIHYGKN